MNGTSMLQTMAGALSWSHFPNFGDSGKELKASPAIVQAIERGEFEKAMVEGSNSFSNLSVLFLPAFLALLPIAVFEDTGTIATVLYAMATDVASAMPIAIKGVELVVYSSQRHYANHANMYGVRTGTGLAVVETWAAECRMKPFVRQRGIGLITLGVSVMALGIVLEIVASRFARKRKKGQAFLDAEELERDAFLRWRSICNADKQKI